MYHEVINVMKAQLSQHVEQEVILERSVGNLFEEFLSVKNRLAEFDDWSQRTLVSLDGEVVRLEEKGFPAKVSQVLKMVIKPDQELRFLPAVAGG